MYNLCTFYNYFTPSGEEEEEEEGRKKEKKEKDVKRVGNKNGM